MGIFRGGPFDFNGDGEISYAEEFTGLMIIEELMREDKHRAERLSDDNNDDDDD